MSYSERELTEKWAQVRAQSWTMPGSEATFAAIDFVLRHADAAGYKRSAFHWRLEATSIFHHGGDPARAFLAFSQLLAAYDSDPELATGHEHDLLWRFKWIVWALPQFPDIPLERTYAVLDDMQRRYQLGGHSLHAVHQHRWLVAHHVGDPAADHWYRMMLTAKRDGLSDCAHCVPSAQVRHLVTLGRDEEAIAVGTPFTNGGCSEQPHWMLSELLLPYLRTGRHEQAVHAHRRGYASMRRDRHHLDNIAQHVFACGISGTEPRGLELFERHRHWLESASSPYAAMEFAAASALVLGRLATSGHGDLAVSAVDGLPQTTVAAAYAQMQRLARDIAARFDTRNGNTHQSSRIEARMSAAPLPQPTPLTARFERLDRS